MTDQFTRRAALAGLGGGVLAFAGAASAMPSDDRRVGVRFISPVTARITIGAVGADEGALDPRQWEQAAQTWTGTGPQLVRGRDVQVRLVRDPFSARVADASGRVVQELRLAPDGALSFSIDDAPLLGLGQGGPQFDRRGDIDEMDAGQGGYRLSTNGAREPIPWVISTSGWAIFVHRPQGRFELTAPRGRVIPARPGGDLDVFVVASRDPQVIMAEYARITGQAEMPPLWSLGYQQSHRTLGSPEEILAEARTFRDKKLPCDAMIYLGTGFCPNGWNTDNGVFDWNLRAFPEPQKAVDALHAMDFRVVLHAVLEGETLTGAVTDPCSVPPLPSGRTPDGKWPPDRQASCYWPVHKPLVEMGIDGWWPDQGDGLDAPSRLDRNRMYFEGQQLYRPNRRVYALHRNTWAGMARYAAFLWSGDVKSTWETLRTHVAVGINAGLSGIPYWGTDIGGFVPTEEYTGELYARWFQFGAFNPLFRSHGRDWRMHLPWGWTLGERGFPETKTWNPDPASLRDPRIEPICKRYLELRYRLLPYIYTAVRQTRDTGLPIIRALWLHYPDDHTAVACGDQYLFGRDLLVAPVFEEGATERRLYLPRGDWFDFWTGERLAGGRQITRPVDLATLPLYVRAGAVLPTGPVKQHTGEHSDEPLTLVVYPGADGSGGVYEDDGDTFDYCRGAFSRIDTRWDDRKRQLVITRSGELTAARAVAVRLAGDAKAPKRVELRERVTTVRL